MAPEESPMRCSAAPYSKSLEKRITHPVGSSAREKGASFASSSVPLSRKPLRLSTSALLKFLKATHEIEKPITPTVPVELHRNIGWLWMPNRATAGNWRRGERFALIESFRNVAS